MHQESKRVLCCMVVSVLVSLAHCKSLFDNDDVKIEVMPWELQGCSIFKDEKLHSALDRVCEMCHDMFRQENPDLRALCRSDCFRNSYFLTCLNIFLPGYFTQR